MPISEPQSHGLAQSPMVDRLQSAVGEGKLPVPTKFDAESQVAAPAGDESGDSSSAPMAVDEPKDETLLATTDNFQAELADSSPLLTGIDEFVVLMDFANESAVQIDESRELTVISGKGYSASFAIEGEAENPIQYAYLALQLPMGEVLAVPQNGLTVVEETENGSVISYAATDFVVGDFSGNMGGEASANTVMANSTVLLSLLKSETGIEVLNFELQTRSQS